ncbi:hypothetical protein [Acidovorax sp. Leaf160]|uniref:hypothetical protein n=1 Tax=Acidovorax sp. Leaf160 TaxID=1736280 RepID=UPI0012E3CD98|nr:hypothetical protein [Acidovorax sp. Leaf160]
MLAEISSLTTALAAAKELGAALLKERDSQKATTIQVDLTDKIVQAQLQLTQILGSVIEKDGRIQALTERVRVLEGEQSEKARYRLAKVGTIGEFFAYQLRPAAELTERADEPTHFLCQPCFDGGKKSVLHKLDLLVKCSVCSSTTQVEPAPPSQPIRRTRGRSVGGW